MRFLNLAVAAIALLATVPAHTNDPETKHNIGAMTVGVDVEKLP